MPLYSDAIAQDVQQQCFELGKYGMYIGGTWYLNYLRTDAEAGRFRFRWGAVKAPVWTAEQRNDEAVIQTEIAVCRASQQKELAWEFIRFAAGAEGARIMASEQMLPTWTVRWKRYIRTAFKANIWIREYKKDARTE